MTTRSYHAENIDRGVKAIPRVLHTRPHNAVNALCCVGRPLHHRSSFREINSLRFWKRKSLHIKSTSPFLRMLLFFFFVVFFSFFVSLCFNKWSFLKQRSNKRKERAHQPSRSSEGWKGVDAEHNDVRGGRERTGKHRENKNGQRKATRSTASHTHTHTSHQHSHVAHTHTHTHTHTHRHTHLSEYRT